MKKFEHVNTIVNIEFYFKFDNITYLREHVYGEVSDRFNSNWYIIGKNEKMKLLTDKKTEEELNSYYHKWIDKNYNFEKK